MAEHRTAIQPGMAVSTDTNYSRHVIGITRDYELTTKPLPPDYEYSIPMKKRPISKRKKAESDHESDENDPQDPAQEEIEQFEHPMNKLPTCYCGVMSRSDSERILKTQPVGTYLLRVSESRDGYTVSLRTTDRCKHFAVEENENGKFVVVGEKPKFLNFNDLIRFYKVHPISPHGDLLQKPMKQQVLLDFYENSPPTRIIPKTGN